MKLEITNENYSATVVNVNNLVDIGLNTLLAFPIFGLQALVPKTTKIGDKLLLFPAEVKLSREYCKNLMLIYLQQNMDTWLEAEEQ